MPNYALFLKSDGDGDSDSDSEIDYYPKLENHTLSVDEIEAYFAKIGVEKWSMYDHIPNEEDIECFSGVCFDSSDGECEE